MGDAFIPDPTVTGPSRGVRQDASATSEKQEARTMNYGCLDYYQNDSSM
jgi:hypothetical protein